MKLNGLSRAERWTARRAPDSLFLIPWSETERQALLSSIVPREGRGTRQTPRLGRVSPLAEAYVVLRAVLERWRGRKRPQEAVLADGNQVLVCQQTDRRGACSVDPATAPALGRV